LTSVSPCKKAAAAATEDAGPGTPKKTFSVDNLLKLDEKGEKAKKTKEAKEEVTAFFAGGDVAKRTTAWLTEHEVTVHDSGGEAHALFARTKFLHLPPPQRASPGYETPAQGPSHPPATLPVQGSNLPRNTRNAQGDGYLAQNRHTNCRNCVGKKKRAAATALGRTSQRAPRCREPEHTQPDPAPALVRAVRSAPVHVAALRGLPHPPRHL